MKLSTKKLIILFLYCPISENMEKTNIPISGRTRLMKMGFLFQKEVLEDFRRDSAFEDIDEVEYFGWKYGPFSRDFLNDLEFLLNQGYIDSEAGQNPIPEELEEYSYWVEDTDTFDADEYSQETFSLSAKGLDKGNEIWNLLTKNQKLYLVRFKQVLNKAPLTRILEYVYRKYKEGYTDNSLIRERYLT